MPSIKVSITNRDKILGAIIRALAVQAAGFQIVGGLGGDFLSAHGYYPLNFAHNYQSEKFTELVDKYVPEDLKPFVVITSSSE